MKRFNLLSLLIAFMIILPWVGEAQEAEWVEQVIVINGNKYEFTPPFVDFVTCQTYNPANGVTSIFDEIMTHSTQDVVISNGKIYVAAGDSIIMYDANTLERLYAVADSGLSRLHIFNDKLIVSKQYPVVRFFVEVLKASDLSLVARIEGLSGDCKGITSTKDSIYVGVYGGYLATEGKLAVIDFNTWTLSREINFGPNAVGINDLHYYGNSIFSINESPFGAANVGSITAFDVYSLLHTNYMFNRKVGASGSMTKNSGIIGNILYFTLNYNVAAFNMDTGQAIDSNLFVDPGSANHIYYTSYETDYVNSELYMNIGNQLSWGIDLVGNTLGDSLTSFTTGSNADAIAMDYRVPTAIDDPTATKGTVALFPNPVEEKVRVKYTGDAPVVEMLIRDITGRTIYRTNEMALRGTWIDCSAFPSGLYFVTIRTETNTVSTKLIKK